MKKKTQRLSPKLSPLVRNIFALLEGKNLSIVEAQMIIGEVAHQLSESVFEASREREKQPLDLFLKQ